MDKGMEREIRRFGARVRAGAFLGGLADGIAVGAIGTAAALLVLRLFGATVAPAWWWAAPSLVVGLTLGARHVARVGFGPRLSAQHLDRRLGLEGLLLTASETDAGAWRQKLEQGLERAASVRPRPSGRRALQRVGLAAGVLLLVAVLPEVVEPKRSHDPLGAEVLQELERKLDALAESDAVDEERAEELRQRLGEVKEGAERDGVLSWSDVDTLEERLRHEVDLEAGKLAQALEGLSDLARDLAESGGSEPVDAQAAAEALDAARQAGLLDALPASLLEKLGLPKDGGAVDPSTLTSDPEALRQLAAALAEAAGDGLDSLADLEGLEGLEGLDLADLDGKLDALLGDVEEGEPCQLCDGDEDCPG